jgi:hypothetical protein
VEQWLCSRPWDCRGGPNLVDLNRDSFDSNGTPDEGPASGVLRNLIIFSMSSPVILIHPSSGRCLEAHAGVLRDDLGNEFGNVNGVYRLAGDGNYAENFGFQWNKFACTLLDRRLAST